MLKHRTFSEVVPESVEMPSMVIQADLKSPGHILSCLNKITLIIFFRMLNKFIKHSLNGLGCSHTNPIISYPKIFDFLLAGLSVQNNLLEMFLKLNPPNGFVFIDFFGFIRNHFFKGCECSIPLLFQQMPHLL